MRTRIIYSTILFVCLCIGGVVYTAYSLRAQSQTPTAVEEAQTQHIDTQVEDLLVVTEEVVNTQNVAPPQENTVPTPQVVSSPPVTQTQAATTAEESPAPPAESVQEDEQTIDVTLKIVPIGASARTYALTLTRNATVYELMVAAREQGFTFKDKTFPGIGRYITTINGVQEDKRAGVYWTLYLNGEYSSVGVSDARIKEGDVVMWKYEKK